MDSTNVPILFLVNFLHSSCRGLIAPVLSTHIRAIGRTHIEVGLFMTGFTVCTMLSKDFLALFKYGCRSMLTLCLFCGFASYFAVSTTSSYWVLAASRYTCGLTNRVINISKEFISKTEPEEKHKKIFNLLEIMETLGFVCGAIGGGYIFNNNKDFETNATIASVCSLTSVLLIQSLNQDPEGEPVESNIPTFPQQCYEQLSNLLQADFKRNWDAFILQMAYISSFTIFFSKFSSLVKYNYHIGIIVVGYTVAYQSMVTFSANFVVPSVRRSLRRFRATKVFHNALLLCAASVMAMYFAPTYECYLIMFVPMIFVYSLVDSLIEENALGLRQNRVMYDAIQTFTKIIRIFVPFIFGIIYHVCGAKAFKLLAMLPPAVCAYVINQRLTGSAKRISMVTGSLRDRTEEEDDDHVD